MHVLSTPIEYLKGVGPIRAELLKKELTLQETMSERVEVRKDLAKCEKKIKELTEQLQKENNGRKITKWNQQS